MENKKEFFLEAYNLEIIKFGKFTLKSGIESPFYVDLRPLASDPKILKDLATHLLKILPSNDFDLLCGVPYAALPMATAMSLESNIPLIEDVITSGKSLLETIDEVESEGLKVSDIVVVLDREQGGKELLERKGYRVHSLFTITETVNILKEVGKITDEEILRIKDFLAGNVVKFEEKRKIPYEKKIKKIEHPTGKKLLKLALEKKSNLIASADVTSTAELLALADAVGPHIVALKTHIDIIKDFNTDKTILPLVDLAKKHNFLLMEDRKFADIGNTQELQFNEGIYKISNWADMITSHLIAGSQALDCFSNIGVIGILGMSCKGTLTDANYQNEALKIIETHPNIMGCVAQNQVSDNILLFTPGVNLETTNDNKGQQYNTPEYVFNNLHTDFIIVGRGIYQSENPEIAAITYKNAGWKAYEKSL